MVTSSRKQGESDNRFHLAKLFTMEMALGLFTLAVFIVLYSLTNFKTEAGLTTFLKDVSYLLPAATALTLIILTGNIDISAGTMMGLCGYAAAYVAKLGYEFYIYMPVAIITGLLLAGLNGIIITRFKVPSIVATLAMVNVHLGLFILLPSGGWVENLKSNFTFLGTSTILNFIPIIFVISLAIFTFFLWFMKYSRFSKKVYAVGGNSHAAVLAGIKPSRVVMQLFLLEGVLIGIAALLFYMPKTIVQSNSTYGMEMLFITASVVGGTSIMGGKGKLLGTAIGVTLVCLINRSMIFMGFQDYYSDAVQGALILIVVLITVTDSKKFTPFLRKMLTYNPQADRKENT
ncbi:MAG: D-ribose high-affinity transport system [Bacilli bacterium]|nr:D-ribose high-affinity transport system [Bacilli bacterium]